MATNLDEPVSVRFPEPMAALSARIAATEGKSLGQWIREIVNAEIARRDGRCPECGQMRPKPGG